MIKRVDIKLGFLCNNFCRFCVQAHKRNKFPSKSIEGVKEILRKERKNGCSGVIFTGGEPTLQKNLIEYVKYAKELNYKEIHIQTNGRFLSYEDYCKKLSEAGANVFSISIHSSNAKIHDFLTRSAGSWSQAVRGVKNLKKINQLVQTNTVIVKQNYKDLPRLAKLLVALGVNKYQFAFIHINPLIQKNSQLIKEIVPRYFQIQPYVKEGLEIGRKKKVLATTEAIPYCFLKRYENHASENGIPDANVYDADRAIKNFNRVRITQGKAKGPNCKKCKHYGVCEGPWRDYPEIFGWDEFKPIK